MPNVSTSVRAQRAVGGQRVLLAPRAVERDHELRSEAFVRGMVVDKRLQFGDDPAVLAERQLRFDALLDRRQAQFLEPGDRRGRERLVGEVGQRRPPPQRKRLPEASSRLFVRAARERRGRLLCQLLEPPQVELLRPHEIAGRTRFDRRAKELAQV